MSFSYFQVIGKIWVRNTSLFHVFLVVFFVSFEILYRQRLRKFYVLQRVLTVRVMISLHILAQLLMYMLIFLLLCLLDVSLLWLPQSQWNCTVLNYLCCLFSPLMFQRSQLLVPNTLLPNHLVNPFLNLLLWNPLVYDLMLLMTFHTFYLTV